MQYQNKRPDTISVIKTRVISQIDFFEKGIDSIDRERLPRGKTLPGQRFGSDRPK
jgi:hypothetical protein